MKDTLEVEELNLLINRLKYADSDDRKKELITEYTVSVLKRFIGTELNLDTVSQNPGKTL